MIPALIAQIDRKLDEDDFESLEQWEQDYYAVYWLIAEGSKGTLLWYFSYDKAEYVMSALAALDRWHMQSAAGIVRKYLEEIFPDGMPKGNKQRQGMMSELSASQKQSNRSLTDDFYKFTDQIRSKLKQIEGEREV